MKERAKLVECSTCEGTGVVLDEDDEPIMCEECDGTGKVWVGDF